MTSGTRRYTPGSPGFVQVTSSTQGLWTSRSGSRSGRSSRARWKAAKASGFFASISATEAGASSRPVSSLIQMFSGVPQNRSRESAQSTLFRRKSPKRPSLMCSGSQCTAPLLASAASFRAVVRMNQAGRAYWMSGSSSDRQQKGYSCRIVSWWSSRPSSRSRRTIALSASLTPLSREPGNVGGEPSVRPHRAGQRDLAGVLVAGDRLAVQVVVHLAEGGGLVHQSGPLVELHEVGGEDPPEGRDRSAPRKAAFQRVEPVPEVRRRGPVAAADEFLAGEGAAHRKGTAEAPGEVLAEGGGNHQPLRFAPRAECPRPPRSRCRAGPRSRGFEGSVQGVVVQTTSERPGSSTSGRVTYTAGSSTSR